MNELMPELFSLIKSNEEGKKMDARIKELGLWDSSMSDIDIFPSMEPMWKKLDVCHRLLSQIDLGLQNAIRQLAESKAVLETVGVKI